MVMMFTGDKQSDKMTLSQVVLLSQQKYYPSRQVLFAGGAAGFAVAHVLTPVELIKCKLQVL